MPPDGLRAIASCTKQRVPSPTRFGSCAEARRDRQGASAAGVGTEASGAWRCSCLGPQQHAREKNHARTRPKPDAPRATRRVGASQCQILTPVRARPRADCLQGRPQPEPGGGPCALPGAPPMATAAAVLCSVPTLSDGAAHVRSGGADPRGVPRRRDAVAKGRRGRFWAGRSSTHPAGRAEAGKRAA
eukprot:360207-Chlamydomonas_euryale.AAC.16